MPAVQIEDEERVGSEPRTKLEPSVYMRKLYETGTPDLGCMEVHGDWGVRAQPGNLGRRLKHIEIGSCRTIREHGGSFARWRRAAR
jgi:hypothetical protein